MVLFHRVSHSDKEAALKRVSVHLNVLWRMNRQQDMGRILKEKLETEVMIQREIER